MLLDLTIGPMFSGKTTKLVRNYYGFIEDNCGSRVLMINHSFDTRYSESTISTHDEDTKIKCHMLTELSNITPEYIKSKAINAIFINEGQFFQDIVQWVKSVSKLNIEIFISGLDGDYKQEAFGNFLDLVPIATRITKLTSKCYKCGCVYAAHTVRITNSTEQVLIGTSDIYKPICSNCLYVD